MKPLLTVLAACLALLAGEIATADATDDAARVQFEQGIELFEQGKYAEAAIAFERAYELKPSYKLLYNMGQVQNQLEHYAAALEAYTRYLAEGGDNVPSFRVTEVKLEIERLNALVGMLFIETDKEGALVFVDDRRQGETPLGSPVFVDLGEHTVVVKREGEELHREVVKVAGGQRVTVKVDILDEVGDADGDGTQPPPPDAPEDERPARLWTWVAFGVGGAAAVGAAVTGGVVLSRASDLKGDCDGNSCPPSVEDELNSTRRLGMVTNVLIGVAGAGIAAGLILFFVEPDDDPGEQSVTLAPTATSRGAGLTLGGRF